MKKGILAAAYIFVALCLVLMLSPLTGNMTETSQDLVVIDEGLIEEKQGTSIIQGSIEEKNRELSQILTQQKEVLTLIKDNASQNTSSEDVKRLAAEEDALEKLAKELEAELRSFYYTGSVNYEPISLEDIEARRREMLQEIIQTLDLDLQKYIQISPGELGNYANLQEAGISLPHFFVQEIPRELGDENPWIFLGDDHNTGIILVYRASCSKIAYFMELDPGAGWQIVSQISA